MALRDVPSLYELSLYCTKYKIEEYLWLHVKLCPMEPKLIRGPVVHSDIEKSSKCETFMRARNQLQSRLISKICEDLLELFCTFKRRRPSEMFVHAALPLLFTAEMKSLITKNTHACIFEWQQIRWHKLRIVPILNLMCAYGTNIVELDILSVYLENVPLFRKSLELMTKLKYLGFSVIPSHSAHPDYNPEDFIQAVGQICQNLIYLHVKLWKATLPGMQKLIYRDYPENTTRNHICDILEYVSIVRFADAVTIERRKAIVRLLLQNFPRLKIVERDEDCVIPMILCEDNMKFETLTRIYCTVLREQQEVETLSKACPNITVFQLSATHNDIALIQNLHLFKKIMVLEVSSNSIHMDDYLQNHGNKITELQYKGYDISEKPVDLTLIGRHCPNVEKLVLRGIKFTFDNSTICPLQNLKTLYLFYGKCAVYDIFNVHVLRWLQTTSVEEIYIRTTTRKFAESDMYFSFPCIKHLCWESFELFFTSDTLKHLVENSPCLETVGSFGAANYRKAFLHDVIDYIRSRNYKVQFLTDIKVFNYFVGQIQYKLSNRVLNTNSIFSISYF